MTVVPPAQLPPIVLMGVSGAGKSVVGNALADASGRVFIDGDDLHPAANKEKMRAGVPLTDADRAPWLRIIGERLAVGDGVIVACSALKRRYRDLLREYAPGTYFAHLDPSREVLRARLAARVHEYMPAGLLDSQLGSLEPLQPDEFGAVFRVDETVDATVADIRAALAD
ncbi:gluconokinase [Humibacter sp. RRB41]|uniref:gluconokinase n=1 Tax=Humibacter sp. RRB41 TaxID=2919946 RepID=UPI001FAB0D03|nr:gluconokinase [Humibacter sp. RRB41]